MRYRACMPTARYRGPMGASGLWLAISAALPAPRCLWCLWRSCHVRAVTPPVVGVFVINPTFSGRVDHQIRVARVSTAGAATADWRPWIPLLGPGGAHYRHRRDGKRETGCDCEITHIFPPALLTDTLPIYYRNPQAMAVTGKPHSPGKRVSKRSGIHRRQETRPRPRICRPAPA